MAWFSSHTALPPKFSSRADAFAYMLALRLDDGCDPMEAARQAGEYADIYARNMGLPDRKEAPAEGIDKYIRDLDKITSYCDAHPKMVDLLLGAVSFIGGYLTGNRAAPPSPPPAHVDEPAIDFDNVQ
jgi:hypothetical protein